MYDGEFLVGAGEGGVEGAVAAEVLLEVVGFCDDDRVELQAAGEDGTGEAQPAA